MVMSDHRVSLPNELDTLLDIINSVNISELSVVDEDGTIYGALKSSPELVRVHPSRVQLWIGAEVSGVSMDNISDAVTFVQGFFCSLFAFPIEGTVSQYITALNNLRMHRPVTVYDRVRMLLLLHMGIAPDMHINYPWLEISDTF